jgi:hypothetical protein
VLDDDARSWPDIVTAIPPRLDPLGATHLIVAIEVSGDVERVLQRVDHAGQLIRQAAEGPASVLRVSLLCYGPHAVHRDDPDVPVRVLAWADTVEIALARLTYLSEQGPVPPLGYSRAARIECVLTEIALRLEGDAVGRPVVVTIGARPAFPGKVDRYTEIIPCPQKNDWRHAMRWLREEFKGQGIAFGAIRDHGQADEVWSQLGRQTLASLRKVDMHGFATDLGLLRSAAQQLPLPLLASESHDSETHPRFDLA